MPLVTFTPNLLFFINQAIMVLILWCTWNHRLLGRTSNRFKLASFGVVSKKPRHALTEGVYIVVVG